MLRLHDVCQGMHDTLGHVLVQSQALDASVSEFEDRANLYHATALCDRLQVLTARICASTVLLYGKHGGKGHVCVFLLEAVGIMFHWVANGEIVADKDWFQARGRTVLSVGEVMALIKDMIDESTIGSWEKAVEWLNKYGKSPRVDFSRIPGTLLLPP